MNFADKSTEQKISTAIGNPNMKVQTWYVLTCMWISVIKYKITTLPKDPKKPEKRKAQGRMVESFSDQE